MKVEIHFDTIDTITYEFDDLDGRLRRWEVERTARAYAESVVTKGVWSGNTLYPPHRIVYVHLARS